MDHVRILLRTRWHVCNFAESRCSSSSTARQSPQLEFFNRHLFYPMLRQVAVAGRRLAMLLGKAERRNMLAAIVRHALRLQQRQSLSRARMKRPTRQVDMHLGAHRTVGRLLRSIEQSK
ncbi:hypothetical protein ACQKWADRAFT_278735, partial [Trichoderma austrokoningii]